MFGRTFTRSGSSIVPPSAEELARKRADEGIERAAAKADEGDPEWRRRAVNAVAMYARAHEFLMAESVRQRAELDGLEPPPDSDPRAWGAIMRAAAKMKYIVADGYAPANSSNRSAKTRWRSLLFGRAALVVRG